MSMISEARASTRLDGETRLLEPRERPVLCSATMVRALLAGTKTQTRRLPTSATSLVDGAGIAAGPFQRLNLNKAWLDPGPSPAGNPGPYLKAPKLWADTVHRVYPRWAKGDRLWVRETWRVSEDGTLHGTATDDRDVHYRADEDEPPAQGCWRSPLFMPRWASRITLDVVEVRVERLQSISEEDATAEGVGAQAYFMADGTIDNAMSISARTNFEHLWDTINGKRASWASNPWVFAISFRRVS